MFNKHVHKRKLEAQAHYKEMVAKYSEDIANSITGTVSSYMGYYNLYKKPITLSVSVSNVDAVTEVLRCCKDSKFGKVCVLNSAHFTKPGGGFIDGAISQEAMLCAESTLYNVLNHFETTYYERSKKRINKHM